MIDHKRSNPAGSLRRFFQKESTAGYVFLFPFLFGFFLFYLVPIMTSAALSFTDYSLASASAENIGINNYTALFSDEVFLKSVRVTLIYVLISVPLKLIFALLLAMVLTGKSRLMPFYRSVYYLPSLIGGNIAAALVWKQLFARRGLINHLLTNAGLSAVNWFGDQRAALIPLILMSIWQFGSSMIIFAAGLKEIPEEYYKAARVDGAGSTRIFLRITLPCLSPIILFNLVMQTISAFMTFTQVHVITQGGPNNATMLYSLYVYKQAFQYDNMGYACAMSWIMLAVIGMITLLLFKTSRLWIYDPSAEERR